MTDLSAPFKKGGKNTLTYEEILDGPVQVAAVVVSKHRDRPMEMVEDDIADHLIAW